MDLVSLFNEWIVVIYVSVNKKSPETSVKFKFKFKFILHYLQKS